MLILMGIMGVEGVCVTQGGRRPGWRHSVLPFRDEQRVGKGGGRGGGGADFLFGLDILSISTGNPGRSWVCKKKKFPSTS